MGAGRKTTTYQYDSLSTSSGVFADLQRNLGPRLAGAIFGCNRQTENECLDKKVFGLPRSHWCWVEYVTTGMPIFLFNYDTRELHGIFRAACDGDWEINPKGWTAHDGERTRFPAQVKVADYEKCPTLNEKVFKALLPDSYIFDNNRHFSFELTDAEVKRLCDKFREVAAKSRSSSMSRSSTGAAAVTAASSRSSTAPTVAWPTSATASAAAAAVKPAAAAVAAKSASTVPVANQSASENQEDTWQTVTKKGKPTAKAWNTVAKDNMESSPPDHHPASSTNGTAAPDAATSTAPFTVAPYVPGANTWDDRSTSRQSDGWGMQGNQADESGWSAAQDNAADASGWGGDGDGDGDGDEEHYEEAAEEPDAAGWGETEASAQEWGGVASAANGTATAATPHPPTHAPSAADSSPYPPSYQQHPPTMAGQHPPTVPAPAYPQPSDFLTVFVPQQMPDGSVSNVQMFEPSGVHAALVGLEPSAAHALVGMFGRMWQRVAQLTADNLHLRMEVAQLRDMTARGMAPQGVPPAVSPLLASPTTGYAVGPIVDNAASQQAVVLQDVYFMGGNIKFEDGPTKWVADYDSYSPLQNKFKRRGEMPVVKGYCGAVTLGRSLYIMGGGNGYNYMNCTHRYDVDSDTWTELKGMIHVRGSLGAAAVGDHIYAVGGGIAKGGEKSGTYYNHVEVYRPEVDTWYMGPHMQSARFATTASVLDGAIYACGGYDGSLYLQSVERLDPRAGKWEAVAGMPRKRGSHSCVVLGPELVCVGGWESSPISSVDAYDPRADAWRPAGDMAQGRSYGAAAVVDGTLYAFGGMMPVKDKQCNFNPIVERYDAAQQTWSAFEVPGDFTRSRSFMGHAVISRMI